MLLFDSLSTGRFVCLHSSCYTHLKGVNISAALDKHGFGPPAFSSLMSCFVALVYSIHPSFLSFFSCLFFFFPSRRVTFITSLVNHLFIYLFCQVTKWREWRRICTSFRIRAGAVSCAFDTREATAKCAIMAMCSGPSLMLAPFFPVF